MLQELWAKIRGVDKWPTVQAIVRSVQYYEEPPSRAYEFPGKLADVTFACMDTCQEHQYGCITWKRVQHSMTRKKTILLPFA